MIFDVLDRAVAALEEMKPPYALVSRWCEDGKPYMLRMPGERPVLLIPESMAWYALLAGFEVME